MAVIGSNNLGIVDIAKRLDPNGDTADVAELLAQTNEIISDIPWIEGNLPTGNRSTIRTGLPTTVWRKLYQGVPPSKSQTAQVDDTCGMLQARSEADVDAVKLANDPAMFRLDEASAFIEKMGQDFCTALLYGDTSINPEQFYGLGPRYSAIAGSNAGQNVISAGATGSDNTSIYLVGWGRNTVFGIYPKNSNVGLQHVDKGEGDGFDANGNRYDAFIDTFKWNCGLVVKDWRYVARLANVDVSDSASMTGTQNGQQLINYMIDLKNRLPTLQGSVRPAYYVNRTIKSALEKMALAKSSSALSIQEAAGQFETNFLGIPIRTVDQILNTESLVS